MCAPDKCLYTGFPILSHFHHVWNHYKMNTTSPAHCHTYVRVHINVYTFLHTAHTNQNSTQSLAQHSIIQNLSVSLFSFVGLIYSNLNVNQSTEITLLKLSL
jgi:hypothetical protein